MNDFNSNLKNFSRENRSTPTDSERKLWKYIRGKQIIGMQFKRQVPISNHIIDFYCHKVKLCIELDGFSHDEIKYEKDVIRQRNLEALGYKFLRFTEQDVKYRLQDVLNTIELTLSKFKIN